MDFMNSKSFKAAVWVLLVFSIVYIGREVSFIFIPIVVMVQLLFLPIFFALILYYFFSPIVNRLERFKIARPLAIIIIYVVLALLGLVLFITVGVKAYEQLMDLIDLFPANIEQTVAAVVSLEDVTIFQRFQTDGMFSVEEIAKSLYQALFGVFPSFQDSVSSALGIITNTVVFFVLLPIFLFYLLKDGKKLVQYLLQQISEDYREEAGDILKEIDHGLASFIQGQIIVSLSVGILMYVGFLIIGMEFALILALFAVFTNVIPYLGPLIATIPAVIVALFTSPLMAAKVLVVIVVVQQIESMLITPQVMGKKLYIHPLTIIILLMFAGSMAGLLGLIIAVPTFVIFKIIFSHLYAFFYKIKTTAKSSR